MIPDTCAPTSTVFTALSVPVLETVFSISPRFTSENCNVAAVLRASDVPDRADPRGDGGDNANGDQDRFSSS